MDNPFKNVHTTKTVKAQSVSNNIVSTNVGRPRKPGVKKYSVSLPITLRDKLATIARGRGMDLSTLITMLGYHLLKNKDDILGI